MGTDWDSLGYTGIHRHTYVLDDDCTASTHMCFYDAAVNRKRLKDDKQTTILFSV